MQQGDHADIWWVATSDSAGSVEENNSPNIEAKKLPVEHVVGGNRNGTPMHRRFFLSAWMCSQRIPRGCKYSTRMEIELRDFT